MNNKSPSKLTHEELDGLNVPRQTYGKTWTLAERRSYARYNPPKPKGSRMWKSEQGQELYERPQASRNENDGSPDEIQNGTAVWY